MGDFSLAAKQEIALVLGGLPLVGLVIAVIGMTVEHIRYRRQRACPSCGCERERYEWQMGYCRRCQWMSSH